MIRQIAQMLEPWKNLYGNSAVVSTTVVSAHILALVVGGGLAIAADRTTLRTLSCPGPARPWLLEELHDVHRPVLIGIVALVATGILMVAADFETFMLSIVFWVKMGLLAVLLVNGAFLYRAESSLAGAARTGVEPDDKFCTRLRLSARLSISLWLVITVGGAILTAAA